MPPPILCSSESRPEWVTSSEEVFSVYALSVLSITSGCVSQRSPVFITRVGSTLVKCRRCVVPSFRLLGEFRAPMPVEHRVWPSFDIRSHVVVEVGIYQGKQFANTFGVMLR